MFKCPALGVKLGDGMPPPPCPQENIAKMGNRKNFARSRKLALKLPMSQVFFKYHEDVNSDRIFPSKTFAIHVTSQRKALLISSSFAMLSREISNAQGMPGGRGGMLMFLFDKIKLWHSPIFFQPKFIFLSKW